MSENSPQPPPRRHRLRRFLGYLLLSLLVLLLLLVASVSITLRTDWPRRLIVQDVQQALGLRFTAEKATTTWLGRTTLQNVTLSLPLADKAFVDVPRMDLEHTSLPWLLITRSLEIDAIRLQRPTLTVQQDQAGRWNLQEAATLIARASGSREAGKPQGTKRAPKLPILSVSDASLTISDSRGRSTTLRPVHIEGKPQGPLVWQYDLKAPPQVDLTGEVAVGGTWRHVVRLSANNLGPWFQPWIKDWPQTAYVSNLRWEGQFAAPGRLSGTAEVEKLQWRDYTAQGQARLAAEQGTLRILPRRVILTTPRQPMDQLLVRDGQIVVDGDRLSASDLQVAAAGGLVRLAGQWDRAANTASLDAHWQELELPGEIRTAGSLSASLHTPWPGQPRIAATLQTTGQFAYGEWNTTVQIEGAGQGSDGASQGWDNLNWTVTAPQLTLQPEDRRAGAARGAFRPVTANDLVAHLSQRGTQLALTDLTFTGGGQITGRGSLDLDSRQWWCWIDAAGWPIPGGQTASLTLDAWGMPNLVQLKYFRLSGGAVNLTAYGWYSSQWPKPVDLSLTLSHPPPGSVPPAADLPVRGLFVADARLNGTLSPLKLDVAGKLTGRNVFVNQRPVGDLAGNLAGQITKANAHLDTQLKLFSGLWDFKAVYPVYDSQGVRAVEVAADVKDLSIDDIADLLERKDIRGLMDGNWTFRIPRNRIDQIDMTGSLTVHSPRMEGFSAQQIKASTMLQGGILTLDPIALIQTDQQGRADATLVMGVRQPRYLRLTLSTAAWQVLIPRLNASLLVNGGTQGPLSIDLKNRSADGELTLSASALLNNQPAANVQLQARLRELDGQDGPQQLLHISKLDADLLQGKVVGQATCNLDRFEQTSAELRFSGLDLARVNPLWPASYLGGLSGKLNGSAVLAPSANPRALEPLALRLKLESDLVQWRGLRFGNCDLYAYLDRSRFVFSGEKEERSILRVADGAVYPWVRITRHPGIQSTPGQTLPADRRDPAWFTQFIADFERLDLNQIVQAANATAEAMPARLAGHFTVMGSLSHKDQLTGNGTVDITDSDLVNFDALQLLYSLLNVGGNLNLPIGYGSLEARLERSALHLTNTRYFNRGIDARGYMDLLDVWQGPDSPIAGGLVGTARPFKDIKLPLISDADNILNTLQSELTSVSIQGTLRDPKPVPVAFKDLGQAMQRFILGDVKNESRAK